MKVKVARIGMFAVAAVLAGCSPEESTAPPREEMPEWEHEPLPPTSAVARAYLNEVVDSMQAHSIRRLEIDWTRFRSRVHAAAPSAQHIQDAYPAIQEALALLGDGHSSYLAANGQVFSVPTRTCTSSGAQVPEIPENIGYVKVGAFSGGGPAATAFAQGIQDAIRAADRDGLVGWIVDLRGNLGGNMWPMVAGVGPLVGEGTLGYFVDPDGSRKTWSYAQGASRLDGQVLEAVPAPYTLRRPAPKIAVLVDNAVASSGEATFISFVGRPNTRSFGVPTCGASTANAPFFLSDGAGLNLTVSTMADRTGKAYGAAVVPDEHYSIPGAMVQMAIVWLLSGAS